MLSSNKQKILNENEHGSKLPHLKISEANRNETQIFEETD